MSFFFFNDTATTEIYTLSLHDALPISFRLVSDCTHHGGGAEDHLLGWQVNNRCHSCWRSEEHTSELQSRLHLVCRLLLEKKKKLQHTTCHDRSLVGQRIYTGRPDSAPA